MLIIEDNDFRGYSIDDILMTAPSSYAVAGGNKCKHIAFKQQNIWWQRLTVSVCEQ